MSLSESDLSFQKKYGRLPENKTKAKKGSRSELEELRAFKAGYKKPVSQPQTNTSRIEPTGHVKVQPQKNDTSKRAQSLAAQKAMHMAVNFEREKAGLPKIAFNMENFELQFNRIHGADTPRVKAADQKAILQAAQQMGLQLTGSDYKTPAELAKETRSLTKSEQQAAMNLAVANELRKIGGR